MTSFPQLFDTITAAIDSAVAERVAVRMRAVHARARVAPRLSEEERELIFAPLPPAPAWIEIGPDALFALTSTPPKPGDRRLIRMPEIPGWGIMSHRLILPLVASRALRGHSFTVHYAGADPEGGA